MHKLAASNQKQTCTTPNAIMQTDETEPRQSQQQVIFYTY